jgi:hypothetical protein
VSPESWLLTNKGSTKLTERCEFTFGIHVQWILPPGVHPTIIASWLGASISKPHFVLLYLL